MKAAQINAFGGTEVIEIVDIDQPSITADQILVKVKASSINPFDNVIRGGMIESLAEQLPLTIGLDFAGEIAEIGANVTGFAVGERVYGSANILGGGSGAFAEYAAVNPGRIAQSPDSISDAEAASLPTAGISALQALVDNGHIAEGQKVFINGGSGGVGVIAIQIAKAFGAYVATTVSTAHVDFAKSLGADEVIDYKTTKYAEVLADYDVALNNVYGDSSDDMLKVLKNGAIVVSIAGDYDQDAAKAKDITALHQMTDVSTKSLGELAKLVDDGKVKPVIAKTYPLDQAAEAFDDKQSGSTQGKIVVTIQ